MVLCQGCRALIDTDADPEACVHDGYLCEACREPAEIVRELNHRANESDFARKNV